MSTNAKEIAERILEPSEERNSLTWEQIQNLARAYLELEKEITIKKPTLNDVYQKQYYVDIICNLKSEIVKLREENAGHEAATERLLGLLEKAIEVLENLQGHADASLLFPHKDRIDLFKAEQKAREFLTTLADGGVSNAK